MGVGSFPGWLRYWSIWGVTTEGLDICSPAVNVDYATNFAELNALWNADNRHWWILSGADLKMRTTQFQDWLRSMRKSKDPALVGSTFRHQDRRMEALFERGAKDDRFWQKEVVQMVLAERAGLLKKGDFNQPDFGAIAWTHIPVPLKDPSIPAQTKPPIQTGAPPAQLQVLTRNQKRNQRRRENSGQGGAETDGASSGKGLGKQQWQNLQGQKGKNQQWQNQQWQQGKNQQQDQQNQQKGQQNQQKGKQGGGKGVKNGGNCLQWTQKGSCSRGANCPWKHPQ